MSAGTSTVWEAGEEFSSHLFTLIFFFFYPAVIIHLYLFIVSTISQKGTRIERDEGIASVKYNPGFSFLIGINSINAHISCINPAQAGAGRCY